MMMMIMVPHHPAISGNETEKALTQLLQCSTRSIASLAKEKLRMLFLIYHWKLTLNCFFYLL
jgi:hypothetical protein